MRTSKILVLALSMLMGSLIAAGAETVELLSRTANNQPGWHSYFPAVSTDGKWAAFGSADMLVLDSRFSAYDIFVRNLATGTLERVSVASDGSEANSSSLNPVLNADGRFVVFESYATNLVPGDLNDQADLFLRDRLLGTTEIVSIATDGTQGIYASNGATISADGRYVAFHTTSPLAPDDVLASIDIYLRDRLAQTTTRIAGGVYPALSSDGQLMAYRAGNSLLLRDLRTGAVETITRFIWDYIRNNPYAYTPSISGDGRYVVYEGWSAAGAPLSTEVFIYDRTTRTSRQLTRAFDGSPLTTASGPYGAALKPKISADGRFVLFFSCAADLVQGIDGNQLYLYDLVNQSTTRLPIDNLWATTLFPLFALSGDGSVVVFQDTISNHLPKYANSSFGVFALRTGDNTGDNTDDSTGDNTGDNTTIELAEPKLTAEPGLLWPPNSKLTDVKLAVTAPGATAVEIRVADEYGTFSQTVHGTEATVKLEAWRKGADQDGRTYTITAVATNAAGQTKTATATVSVPHDQR